MSLNGFFKALLAYILASIFVVVLAAVALSIVQIWLEVTYQQLVSGLWMVVVGIPSCGYAMQKASKALGIRPTPHLGVASWRSVPIFGGAGATLTDAVGAVLGRQEMGSIEIPDRWAFLAGSFVFKEDEISDLLHRGWARQRRGLSAFARAAVLDGPPFYGDRQAYECWCDVCEAVGFLVNRQDRHSGKLTLPPALALSELVHRVRRTRIN
jgi:hypothetical protein